MTWEQKFAAMQSLVGNFNICLRMRGPGDWYVCVTGRELRKGRMLHGVYGNGGTPEEAVNDDWQQIAESGATIVLSGKRREVRWNGYMWEDVPKLTLTS